MPHPQTPSTGDPSQTLAIGFSPEAVLERDSRVLLDPAFLATLHTELAAELSPEDAAISLLQMGFLHGLQDATRALAHALETRQPDAGMAIAPPLSMPVQTRPSDGPPGALLLEGYWPDAHEAAARLSAGGIGAGRCCHLSAGYTSGWLSGTFDADLLAVETDCAGTGRSACRFIARECDDWRARRDPGVEAQLDALPFAAFRALVRDRCARDATRISLDTPDAEGVDRRAAVVHIWGPVMVIPYAGPDEALHALELMARDPGAAEVSVIVLDLAGAIVDEAFGALALEQLVQTAEAWGTETLFADPSPLSERVIAELDHQPLLVMKDLDEAVALAFQIATSQRRLV